ncbi:hypothetical protein ACFQ05_25105 [Amycolatopsis umgeniensis]|uniref:Uncharacterized protein n=1 Tax=Amycolatopsis umgeniensis TaxID=336628 RepID=A0A841BBW5_9PSEU|nr:hypothetical protein [Amycolatopsis umgeniensis]MBB5856158.1 hypothetical protein [Amycolatopsis umgeniensis]
MDDLDVRSALTEYVTEAEPPIRLTGRDVLAAGRRSQRRRLSAGVTGAALAVVAILGVTSLMTAPPQQPQTPPQPAQPVEVDRCGTRAADETAQQVLTRLSCVVGTAVRSRVTPGARIEKLTLPGEIPPSDPFLLTAKRYEEEEGSPLLYYLDVRVSDDRGAGSLHVRVLPPVYDGLKSCEDPTIPKTASCSVRQTAEGVLLELTTRNEEGLIVRTAHLKTPTGTIYLITNNTGAVETGDGVHLPVERAEPPLTATQLQEIAATPGLVP